MRNIFLFIRRYFTFLAFLVFQFIALWMLFKYNRYHHATFLGVASEVTGSVNKQVDRLDDYFHQGEENRRVHRMNDSLMNILKSNFSFPDSAKREVVDTVLVDSSKAVRRYYWLDAKVVYNTINFEKNYLQLNRGSRYGIKDNMSVLNSDGAVVGVVVNVSPNFSQVMSLLHIQSSVSAALKKTGEAGKIIWDGRDPRFLTLTGIAKSAQIKVGDTVLTSKYSYNFPPDKVIGTIANIANDPSTGFYLLRIRTAVNFNNVQQVFVVENLQREEQDQLNKDTEKKIDQQKTPNR
ncbi:MAG TPA: rod shape-determining protein MreC [Flavisolibacter sp.]|jgi:rod shape-determining protein MreC|nr:rod shape-determining protein MreC [Flavisolibacter sp.]